MNTDRKRILCAELGQGRRFQKRIEEYQSGVWTEIELTRFLYDDWNLIAEYVTLILESENIIKDEDGCCKQVECKYIESFGLKKDKRFGDLPRQLAEKETIIMACPKGSGELKNEGCPKTREKKFLLEHV